MLRFVSLGGLSAGVVSFCLQQDYTGLKLHFLPTVYALTKEASAEATKEVDRGGQLSIGIRRELLRWLGQQVGFDAGDTSKASTESFTKEVITRGMVIVCAGTCLWLLKEGSVALWQYLKEQFTLTVVFASFEQPYRWLLQWLADQPFAQNSHILDVTKLDPTEEGEDGEFRYTPTYVPGVGVHHFYWHGHWIRLERSKVVRYSNWGSPQDGVQLSLTLMGTKAGTKRVVTELLHEARRHTLAKDKSKTVVYLGSEHGTWERATARPIRPMSSVILADGVGEYLLEDIRDYLSKDSWYSARGIPYRRGYLLYGSPGCGKTSFITALAGELKLHIYVVNLASEKMSDESLLQLMRELPYRCILLFEDIDAAFINRYETESEGSSDDESKGKQKANRESEILSNGITFSGLINAIDGVASQEGRLLFFTTNHYDKLSKTLIRPGRIDTSVEIGLATKSQIRRMFLRFYQDDEVHQEEGGERAGAAAEKGVDVEKLAEEFTALVPEKTISMAKLQGYFMRYKYNPVAAVKSVQVELLVGM